MPITAQHLLQILPNAGVKAGVFAPALNTAMQRFQSRFYGRDCIQTCFGSNQGFGSYQM